MPAPTITPLPTPPSRSTDPTNFAIEADAFVAALPEFATDANAQATYLDGLAATVDADAALAEASASIAAGAANYQGDYSAGTTYQIGESVSYSGRRYVAKTVNTGVTPVDGVNWLVINDGDVTGPSSATANGIALYDGTTGKIIKAGPAPGTAGNVLTSDGTTWTSAAITPSKYELIATVNASGASTVDFTGLSSTYAAYEVVMTGIYASTAILDLLVRTSSNNGVSFDSGAGNYATNHVLVSDSGAVSGQSSSPAQINMGYIHTSGDGIYASLKLVNAGVSRPFGMEWTLGSYLSNIYHWRGVALRKSNTAVNAIRLFPSSGTITGTFKLYGIRA